MISCCRSRLASRATTWTLLHVGVAAALLLSPTMASAQITPVGATTTVLNVGLIGSDIGYDPVNSVYLVVTSYGPTWGQFVDTSGQPVGAAFRIGSSNNPCPWGNFPAVQYGAGANGGAGGFLVTWHQEVNCSNGGNSVNAAIVAYPTGVITAQQVLSGSNSHFGQHPAIAYSATSQRFLVAWTAGWTIQGVLVGSNGLAIGAPTTLIATSSQFPSLTWNSATDEFGLAFARFSNSSASAGFARVRASDAAVMSNIEFGVSAGTYVTDVDYNPTTANYLMGWSLGGGSSYAEINAAGALLGTGLISNRIGKPTSFSVAFNPQSGTFLTISEDDSKEVVAAELNRSGVPNSTAGLVTNSAPTLGSYFPRVVSRPDVPQWNISFARDWSAVMDQLVATSSTGGGGGGGGGTTTYQLTITPPTGGTITAAGINCGDQGSLCSKSYDSGTQVTLTATPSANFALASWTGDCAPSGTTTMTANRTCGATFNSTGGGGGGGGPYTLTITPPTGGTITSPGINCGVGGSACSTSYASGFPVSLTATPAAGYTFGIWTGACVPNGTTTMTADKTCGATFKLPPSQVDLDGDGDADVLTFNPASGAFTMKLSDGNGGFTSTGNWWSPGWVVTPANFNQDGLTDAFLINPSSGHWFKMLNTGGTGFTAEGSGFWWPGWQRFVADLDGDGVSDVFLWDPNSGTWFKCLSTAGGFTYIQGSWSTGWELYPMRQNADTLGDFFLFHRTTGQWFMARGTAGGFTYPQNGFWSTEWQFVPGDYNGDSLTDLLLYRPTTGQSFVATTGASGFTMAPRSLLAGSNWNLHPLDLDGDGTADLFMHDPTTGQWFELRNDGSGFVGVGGGIWELGWKVSVADLNGDGRDDLLLYRTTSGMWFQALNLTLGTFSYTNGFWNTGLVTTTGPFMK